MIIHQKQTLKHLILLRSYYPAILWIIGITYLSTKGGISLPESVWDILAIDKFGHAFVYAVLVILIFWGNKKQRFNFSIRNKSLVLLGSALYGVLMEYIQFAYFPNRYFETLDILANIIGCILGYIVYKFVIIKYS